MPEIRGTLAIDGRTFGPCVWCGDLSDALGETPGRPDLGSLPIHVFCAGAVIVAYRRAREGRLLAVDQVRAFEGRLRELSDGRAPAPARIGVRPGSELEREIASRNAAFAGGTFAVRDPLEE